MTIIRTTLAAATQQHPPGTVLGKYHVQVKTAPGGLPVTSQSLTLPLPPDITFDLAPGDYTVTAVQLNTQGIPIGAAHTEALNVPAPAPVVGPLITDLTFTPV
jgi:hypothetical protein